MNKKSSVRIGILLLAVCAAVGAAYWLLHGRAGTPAPQAQAGQPPAVAVQATPFTPPPLPRHFVSVRSLPSNYSLFLLPLFPCLIPSLLFSSFLPSLTLSLLF